MNAIRPPPLKLKAKKPFPPYDKGAQKVDIQMKKRESKSGMNQLKSSWMKFAIDIQTPTAEVMATGVTINGYPVNASQVLFLAETFDIRLRSDHNYWYDKESGFFGKMGGILQKHIDPRLKILGDLDPRSSAGDTGIFINGREILKDEKKNWKRSGMLLDQHYERLEPNNQQSSSFRYSVDPLGNVFEETSGNLLFNWRQKYMELQKKQLAIGATVVGVALLGGLAGGEGMLFGGGEEAMLGVGGDSFYSSDMTGAASSWDASGAGYISFDDGSSVSIGL